MVKPKLGYDDSLDAFGIHGIGGMIGALGTGIVYAPMFGGPGDGGKAHGRADAGSGGSGRHDDRLGRCRHRDRDLHRQGADRPAGLAEEVEAEGLDLGEHGERAYNY